MKRQRQRGLGLTLLECLLALALFSLIGAAAYSGLDSVLAARAALTQGAARLAQLQLALQLLERDIEQLADRPIRDEFGLTQPALRGDNNDPRAVLELTSAGWVNPLGQPRASLQRLRYRLQDGQWLRGYWEALDRGGVVNPRETVVLEAVAAVRVRFLDQHDTWHTQWPLAQDGAHLPRAVEVSLSLRDWGEIVRLLRVVGA